MATVFGERDSADRESEYQGSLFAELAGITQEETSDTGVVTAASIRGIEDDTTTSDEKELLRTFF